MAVLLLASANPPVVMADEWQQLGANPQRTGYVATELPTPWRVRWIWNGPASGGDSGPASGHLRLPKGVQPITGDGKLYVGHSDGLVRAISEITGQVVWTSANLGAGIVNTGAYDPGSKSVYFGAQNGKFYQLDSATGTQKRVVDVRGSVEMAPLLAGNTVYVGSKTGTLYALDKDTLVQRWSYEAGALLIGSPSYSSSNGGLVILLAEDKTVHAVQASDGSRRWRVTVNADADPLRSNTVFANTYPVVADGAGVVLVRSYLLWDKMWLPSGGAPSTVSEIRTYLTQNPTYQSFHVLDLGTGAPRFVAPVMVGAIGNGGDFEAAPPQAVVKRLPDNSEVAYVIWRSRQACSPGACDGRDDTTLGEMSLQTGEIRFVRDYKNSGSIRYPTDEQSPISMAGNSIFHAHWMLLGGVRITDRSAGLGGTFTNPIATQELPPVLNTLSSGTCSGRSGHACPTAMTVPCDGFGVDPGFYVYYASSCAYDQYWTTPVRSAVISNGTLYWKSIDGAITAMASSVPASPTAVTVKP
jgi:outer membrane protein assembly factor BamB